MRTTLIILRQTDPARTDGIAGGFAFASKAFRFEMDS
jgi:hypothetical protein